MLKKQFACADKKYLSCLIHSKRHSKINFRERSHIVIFRKLIRNHNIRPSPKAVHTIFFIYASKFSS